MAIHYLREVLPYLFYIFWFLMCIVNFNLTKKDIKAIKDEELVIKVKSLSYVGIIDKIRIIGFDYTISAYLVHSLLVTALLGYIFYYTIGNIIYTFILVSAIIFVLPLFNYLKFQSRYNEKLLLNVFTYIQTCLIYLREKRAVMQILNDCATSLEQPLQDDVFTSLEYIGETGSLIEGLDLIETKYNYSIIKNLHILFKGKYYEGVTNDQLYDHIFDDVEGFELTVNNYHIRRKANDAAFYTMLLLNSGAVLFLVNALGGDMVDTKSAFFQNIILVYYLLNFLTVVFYEWWNSKTVID